MKLNQILNLRALNWVFPSPTLKPPHISIIKQFRPIFKSLFSPCEYFMHQFSLLGEATSSIKLKIYGRTNSKEREKMLRCVHCVNTTLSLSCSYIHTYANAHRNWTHTLSQDFCSKRSRGVVAHKPNERKIQIKQIVFRISAALQNKFITFGTAAHTFEQNFIEYFFYIYSRMRVLERVRLNGEATKGT